MSAACIGALTVCTFFGEVEDNFSHLIFNIDKIVSCLKQMHTIFLNNFSIAIKNIYSAKILKNGVEN